MAALKARLLAFRRGRLVAGVGAAMQPQRGHGQHGGRRQQRRVGPVGGVAFGIAPAMAVGMQHYVGPVGIVEGARGLVESVGRVPGAGRPRVPHGAGELTAVAAHGLGAARRRHEPVIPVIACLAQRQHLVRVVRAIAHRQQYQLPRDTRPKAAGVGGGSRAPVVAHQQRAIDTQRIDEVQQVAAQGGQFAAARRGGIAKAGRPETAQGRAQHAVAIRRQASGDGVPAFGAVGPAVQQHGGRSEARRGGEGW
ncbi:hypothetical protein G6F35_014854 [Rhizopus arrhizus]|nr:hypothetical protein G6F35_014854 [Rhizopus arrhizus]